MDFVKYPKTARLNSPFDITEKIDGTNAAVLIRTVDLSFDEWDPYVGDMFNLDGQTYQVAAQSRTRVITPNDDNYGFAAWVSGNAESLVKDLGPGTHFGEWWGSKIQRAYGMTNGERYFSLFDNKRYSPEIEWGATEGLRLAPLMVMEDEFEFEYLEDSIQYLRDNGSTLNGFDRPEGVVLHFHHNGTRFKYILDK